jgi:hypothetical protein
VTLDEPASYFSGRSRLCHPPGSFVHSSQDAVAIQDREQYLPKPGRILIRVNGIVDQHSPACLDQLRGIVSLLLVTVIRIGQDHRRRSCHRKLCSRTRTAPTDRQIRSFIGKVHTMAVFLDNEVNACIDECSSKAISLLATSDRQHLPLVCVLRQVAGKGSNSIRYRIGRQASAEHQQRPAVVAQAEMPESFLFRCPREIVPDRATHAPNLAAEHPEPLGRRLKLRENRLDMPREEPIGKTYDCIGVQQACPNVHSVGLSNNWPGSKAPQSEHGPGVEVREHLPRLLPRTLPTEKESSPSTETARHGDHRLRDHRVRRRFQDTPIDVATTAREHDSHAAFNANQLVSYGQTRIEVTTRSASRENVDRLVHPIPVLIRP